MRVWFRRHVWDSKWGFRWPRIPLSLRFFAATTKNVYARGLAKQLNELSPLFSYLSRKSR